MFFQHYQVKAGIDEYLKQEAIDIKVEITGEELPDIMKQELDDLDADDYSILSKDDVKMEFEYSLDGIDRENCTSGAPKVNILENLAKEEQLTMRRVQEMVDSWGIVKWKEYSKTNQNSFRKFWRESFASNIKNAVSLNFITKKGGAALLGIKAGILKSFKHYGKEFPVIVQDMIDRWGIVKKAEYTAMGRSDEEFWKESFVKNVLYSVQREILSSNGASLLLGAEAQTLQHHRYEVFGRKSNSSPLESAPAKQSYTWQVLKM